MQKKLQQAKSAKPAKTKPAPTGSTEPDAARADAVPTTDQTIAALIQTVDLGEIRLSNGDRLMLGGYGIVGGHIPLGYYKDPEKTAATFPVIDGVRWSVPGCFVSMWSW